MWDLLQSSLELCLEFGHVELKEEEELTHSSAGEVIKGSE